MINFSELEQKIAQQLEKLKSELSLDLIDDVRIKLLGKNGEITKSAKLLAKMSIEQKKLAGQKLNNLKKTVAELLAIKKQALEEQILNQQLSSEKIDLTLPTRHENVGRIHPLTQATEEVMTILGSLGFSDVQGPDIEDDFHNFTALNIPEIHPARQMHDTFYMQKDEKLLRTHTSSVQIRHMKELKPPFRIMAPGRCYRCDWDATHTPMFHQIEGLVIDKDINMSHLKGCIIELLSTFFEKDNLPIRLRPSYFPFTEPSAEVDIGCSWKNKELIIGEGDEWLEILGCGMVHPNVLKNVGIDPEEYQGFAFGIGLERLAMLKYGISDLRNFFNSDIRWMNHYGFSAFDIPSLIKGLTR